MLKRKIIISAFILGITLSLLFLGIINFRVNSLNKIHYTVIEYYTNWLEYKEGISNDTGAPSLFLITAKSNEYNFIKSSEKLFQQYKELIKSEKVLKDLNLNIEAKIKFSIQFKEFNKSFEQIFKKRLSMLHLYTIFLAIVLISFGFLFYAYLFRRRTISNSEIQLQTLSAQLLATYEGEKKLLALDIHDDIAQELYTARLLCGNNNEAAKRIESSLKKLRNISYQLQPPELDILGFPDAIDDLCRNLHTPEEMKIKYNCSGLNSLDIDYKIKIHLYRIIQESLHNSIKHSKATLILLNLIGTYPLIRVEIKDNGCGFSMDKPASRNDKKLGLKSIKERIKLINGRISIKSSKQKGTSIILTVPLN